MWFRVLVVLVAVACVIDVGDALFKGFPNSQAKEYFGKVREKLEEVRAAKKKGHVRDYGYWNQGPMCPLMECYWGNCSDFAACVESASRSQNYCRCSLNDIMYSKSEDSCVEYDYMYSWGPPDHNATTCSGCLSNMDRIGFYGDDFLAFNCERRRNLTQVERCFDQVEDSECLERRFGLPKKFVFEGISMQLDGCPTELIRQECQSEHMPGFSMGCGPGADDKIKKLKDCWREKAGVYPDCNIGSHEEFLEAGANAVSEGSQRFCNARAEAVAEKRDKCNCEAEGEAGKRHGKPVFASALRDLLKALEN